MCGWGVYSDYLCVQWGSSCYSECRLDICIVDTSDGGVLNAYFGKVRRPGILIGGVGFYVRVLE